MEKGKETPGTGRRAANGAMRGKNMSQDNRTMICPQCRAENLSWRSRCQTCNTLLHEEEVKIKPPRGVLWWIAFIISLVYALLFFFVMVVMGGIWWLEYLLSASIPDFLPVVLTVLAFGSVVVAWKWRLAGGILLVVIGLLLVVGLAIFVDSSFAVFFMPFPVLGILFVVSWRVARRYTDNRAGKRV